MAKKIIKDRSTGGSTAEGMIDRMEAYNAMSHKERQQLMHNIARRVMNRQSQSESDMAMLKAADGYFED